MIVYNAQPGTLQPVERVVVGVAFDGTLNVSSVSRIQLGDRPWIGADVTPEQAPWPNTQIGFLAWAIAVSVALIASTTATILLRRANEKLDKEKIVLNDQVRLLLRNDGGPEPVGAAAVAVAAAQAVTAVAA